VCSVLIKHISSNETLTWHMMTYDPIATLIEYDHICKCLCKGQEIELSFIEKNEAIALIKPTVSTYCSSPWFLLSNNSNNRYASTPPRLRSSTIWYIWKDVLDLLRLVICNLPSIETRYTPAIAKTLWPNRNQYAPGTSQKLTESKSFLLRVYPWMVISYRQHI